MFSRKEIHLQHIKEVSQLKQEAQMNFNSIFKRFKSKPVNPDIEFAFNSGGVDYYCFKDVNKMPAKRALMSFTIYNEMDMRCNREYLIDFKKSLDACINGKFQRTDVAQLSVHLGERLTLAVEPNLLLKLATVYYFEKEEDVSDYDFTIAAEKIKKWKEGDINAFFLNQHIGKLINLSPSSKTDFRSYLESIEEIERIQQTFQSEVQYRNSSIIGS
jgi:hypothetical protein